MAKSQFSYDEVPLIKHLSPIFRLVFRLYNALINIVSGPTEVPSIASLSNLEQTLYRIAYEVVVDLGYIAARVAIIEQNNRILRSLAYFIDPDLLEIDESLSYQERIDECERQVKLIEQYLSTIARKPVGLKAPIAQVDLKDKRSRENLGVRAIEAVGGPRVVSDPDLFSLFTPVLPESARGAVREIQKRLDICEVAAVPLLSIQEKEETVQQSQLLGILFVASRREISDQDKSELKSFGQRASKAISIDQNLKKLKAIQESNVSNRNIEESSSDKRQRYLKDLLNIHLETLYELELKKAKYGIDTPISIIHSIKEEEGEIERIKQELENL